VPSEPYDKAEGLVDVELLKKLKDGVEETH
jgi:hypothetical protein